MFNRVSLATVAILVALAVIVVLYIAATTQMIPNTVSAAPSSQTTASETGIFISGTGRVSIKPNIVQTSIGVEVTANNLAEATSQANTKSNAVIEKIKSMGVDAKDIQTTNYSVQPITQQRPNTTPSITGYRINNQLSVRIRKMEDAGKILDAAIAAGANNIYGVSFGVDDPTPYQQQARAAAVKDAMDKAGQLAKAANIQLGKVLTISEGSTSPRPVARAMNLAMSVADAAVPLESGELEISVTVEMKFAVP